MFSSLEEIGILQAIIFSKQFSKSLISTIWTVPYKFIWIFQNKRSHNIYFTFESSKKVATKLKTRSTVNFHTNTMNVHIGNLVLQLKMILIPTTPPNQFKVRKIFIPKPIRLLKKLSLNFLWYILYIISHIFKCFAQNLPSWLPY